MNSSIIFTAVKAALLSVLLISQTTAGFCLNPWSTTLSAPVVWHPLEVQEGLAAIRVTDLVPGMEYKLELSGEGSLCMEWFSLKNGSQIIREPAKHIIFIAEGTEVKLMWDQVCEAHFTMNLIHVEKELATRHPGVEETTELHTLHINGVEDLRSLDTTDVGGLATTDGPGDKLQGRIECQNTRYPGELQAFCQLDKVRGKNTY
ncbi:MAG: hypothetical protein H6568_10975 [Lewinellaceae bacterium]|mgnify:CR=1 FL=1|nr:hypothetical protein [Saprospiraceae bacterium]MCB9313279.1 hypothetical protein [Lewinellaceae bacterium]HRW75906.1 hypothetical protein [Saprospiraceae bacterium]